MLDFESIRKNSIGEARFLGYPTNPDLPLLADVSARPVEDIVDRSLAMSAAVSAGFGFEKRLALEWLERENLMSFVAQSELDFLRSDDADPSSLLQCQVEGLNAFAWALSFVDEMPFYLFCPDDLVKHFPDFNDMESSERFRGAAKLRPMEDIVSTLDAAYCIHWSWAEQDVHQRDLPDTDMEPYMIVERRRALEWILSGEDWDNVSLDT